LKGGGSDRKLYRLTNANRSVIGVTNPDRQENVAFLEFSRHFRRCGLPVPLIYVEDLDQGLYLEEDLGDTTLFQLLTDIRAREGFSSRLIDLYTRVVQILPQFQIVAGRTLDYSLCYPRSSFDRQSMMWDLSYFKYYFLKLAQIPFNEQALEDDFNRFTEYLLQAERDFFLYRDFQSRNIMIKDGEPYFIDYQGGRKGALQYDIASLLFDAKADIPFEVRDELLNRYLEAAAALTKIDREEFMRYYYGYVYIRIVQALGAYGFRGFYERKRHFLQSVPYAIRNLEVLLRTVELPMELPMLMQVFKRLVTSSILRQFGEVELKMTVRIQSFSYSSGMPGDEKGHGGGFVFDCRALPNPGRFEQYQQLTGKDAEVIAFLEKEPAVHRFMSHVYEMIDQVVENYQSRNFTDLLVAFGCTGGQHRSVYCAGLLAKHLREKHNVNVEVRHRELEKQGV
ncbi:MAG: phosphotransferase, partial [candidate division KSB1 bacterium]|nr:phosphotransferase [candidate division KSB1 bacterium]